MAGIFEFPLLRAEKRDTRRWLIPLAVAGLVGGLGGLCLDLVVDLVFALVPSCYGVGCTVFPREHSLLSGLMGGSNLDVKDFFLSHSLPTS